MNENVFGTAIVSEHTALTMHPNTFIGDFVLVNVRQLIMMPGSQINAGAKLTGQRMVFLGMGSVISFNALLMTSTDQPNANMCDNAPEETRNVRHGSIVIGNNAFIGSNAVIFPGVTIGNGAVIGAGAVIKEDVAPWTINKPDYKSLIVEQRRMRVLPWIPL